MSRLDDYRSALLAAHADVTSEQLDAVLDSGGAAFAAFVVDHGLGPLWHERSGRDEFHAARMQSEALYLSQQSVLREVGSILDVAGILHVVIKGAANRHVLYDNPAVRACHDLDLLVRRDEATETIQALARAGFEPRPKAANISIELMLTRGDANIDLHWRLLRDGRLRDEDVDGMLERRRKIADIWTLDDDDMAFLLLVHPAFNKHLAGWEMGLHRVADIVALLERDMFEPDRVIARLADNRVRTAAWATLRWVELLMQSGAPPLIRSMMPSLEPGAIRRRWLDFWLRGDLSARTMRLHGLRLAVFSLALHDTPAGAWRAVAGRYRAHRRSAAELAVFEGLHRQ